MADDTPSNERRSNRASKAARVIEATAVDVTPAAVNVPEPEAQTVETAARQIAEAPPVPVEAVPEPSPGASPGHDKASGMEVAAESAGIRTSGGPEQTDRADPVGKTTEPEEPPKPDIIPPPVVPPVVEKPRYALPIAAAGLAGALFGAGAGVVVPSLSGGAPQADLARIQRLEQGMADLARRPVPSPAPAAAPGNAAEVQALQQRIAALEADLKRRMDGQDQKIAAIPAPPPAVPPSPPVNLAPLTGRIDAMDRALAALDQKAEGARAAVADGLKAVEPRIVELAAGLGRTAQRVEATAAAPVYGAAQALNQAFQRGAPFALEIGALEALGVRSEQVQALKAASAKGLPSPQQIAEAFKPLAAEAARAGQPVATGAQAILGGFVRTRPAGPDAADTPEGHVSAIQKALAGGDVAAALAAWAKLPEAARKATEAWAAMARDREVAAKAIRDIQDQALAALKKAAP